mmetsp:Transcript_4408/g.6428  ORF Transcript_4408/g.6428 Transcript_4408/m.6428 type:complete len:119 (+) Transcript_4408:1273-1629(+)
MVEFADNGVKLTLLVASRVLHNGILLKVGKHQKHFAVVQNKYATTIKQFIMCITGTQELSREILHKQINFIFSDEHSAELKDSLFGGKNYSTSLIRAFTKMGINLKKGIQEFEDRFMI